MNMCASVQFSCSVVSNSLQPHELQHAGPPCPSPTPGVHPNPCPFCQWHHPTISFSVVPFPSLPSIFLSIRVFSNESALRIRWPKYWNFSFNISPSNEHTYIRNKLSCITFSIINIANTFVNYIVSNSPSSLHEEKSAKLKLVVTKKRTVASYDLDWS